MNKIKKCISLSILMLLVTAEAENFNDAEVKRHIWAECSVIDSVKYAEWQHKVAMRKCNWDTNRYVRLAKEMVVTASGLTKDNLLGIVTGYGDSGDLPFIYTCLADGDLASTAVRGILRIEGVTTNSIQRISGCLCMTNMSQEVRSDVCEDLFAAIHGNGVDAAVREYGVSNALVYAGSVNRYFMSMDVRMCAIAPSYKYSCERLTVLRKVERSGINQIQYQYITNSIRELVEYPESDLIHFLR